MMTGMAGAFLSMGYVGLFSSGMTEGRGYIALATQAIAAGNAVIGMLASLLFGFCQSLCELSPELFDPAAVYPDDAVSDHYYCVYGLLRDGSTTRRKNR